MTRGELDEIPNFAGRFSRREFAFQQQDTGRKILSRMVEMMGADRAASLSGLQQMVSNDSSLPVVGVQSFLFVVSASSLCTEVWLSSSSRMLAAV